MTIAERETEILCYEIDAALKRHGIHHGSGPQMAYFQTERSGEDGIPGKSYIYVTLVMKGPKSEGEQGNPPESANSFAELLGETVKNFEAWLSGNNTLLWRKRPEVDFDGVVWRSRMRCIQLESDEHSFLYVWEI
jgi:hypothetical protein